MEQENDRAMSFLWVARSFVRGASESKMPSMKGAEDRRKLYLVGGCRTVWVIV